MRTAFFFLFAPVLFSFGSCEDLSILPNGPYDFMLFERSGGGNLEFNVSPSPNVYAFEIDVIRFEFRDTTIQMQVSENASNATTFEALKSALNGQYNITGDFTQSRLPTGTWVRVYMVKGSRKEEVTNIGLRNSLVTFEQIVRDKLDQLSASIGP